MPLPPPPQGLFAQIKAKNEAGGGGAKPGGGGPGDNRALLASLQKRRAAAASGGGGPASSSGPAEGGGGATTTARGDDDGGPGAAVVVPPPGEAFAFDDASNSFVFDRTSPAAVKPRLVPDARGNADVDVAVPLGPCVYRMTDYTYAKGEPVELSRCVNKLGVLRCLERECGELNALLWSRLRPGGGGGGGGGGKGGGGGSIEEDELGKARFMELLSNCGVYQKASELILAACNRASDDVAHGNRSGGGDDDENPYRIPQVRVEGLSDFLAAVEERTPALAAARDEIATSSNVSFHPGLGELFHPGSRLVCFPEGMEGTPLGVRCVQCWYDEELNRATGKVKRKFVLVVEFLVSVGSELVFVAASEVYPEFPDAGRSVPLRELNHRRLDPPGGDDRDRAGGDGSESEDAVLVDRMRRRGEFYASVATDNHYLEYHPNSFFPVRSGGWSSDNAVRPLTKSGRVMVDVSRGALAGHVPIRGSSDGMSDTVKEAMRLFDQSKRTGVAVPFRTAILPGFDDGRRARSEAPTSRRRGRRGDSDEGHLWMAWPMLVGFSFTARCWGKLLLSLPRPKASSDRVPPTPMSLGKKHSPKRPSIRKMGVELAGLGGVGECGNVNYISFHEKAFDQLVLADEKKVRFHLSCQGIIRLKILLLLA